MGIFFIYIVKAAFSLVIFYLFYKVLLTRETFHRFNRITLLAILTLSMLLPLCKITLHPKTERYPVIVLLEEFWMATDLPTGHDPLTLPEEQTSFPWISLTFFIYLTGLLFFIIRYLWAIGSLLLLIKKSKRIHTGKLHLVIHNREISPFSWLHYLILSEKDLCECGKEIITHETAHLKKLHSMDLIVADLCIFFQWFNPAAWLLKQELQNIHEYEADEEVLNAGIDARTYQLLLIKKLLVQGTTL
ncbi:MAG: peptidase M56 [Bacteroides sp.]|nr:peptidase M56 [Bacteroides sp.]